MRGTLCLVLLSIVGACRTSAAGQVLPPVNDRFGVATDETPDFQRHVSPLLGRLGCNGRACHGSFQGQGGFRLSLFGYDFKSDHEALVGGERPRVDSKHPANSLIVQKPTLAVDHQGGQRHQAGGWEHRLLLNWVAAGAPGVVTESRFVSLEVQPAEIVFSRAGQKRQLKAIAHWADGSQEDVTALCRFRTNDESVATVDEGGRITAAGQGGTHVIAFYDNGTTGVNIVLPVTDLVGKKYPTVVTPTRIDELVVARLRTLGIVPSDNCTDAEFLRRVSLDITGTLPRPDEVQSFLADDSAGKRARKVDELLARPAYAAWWTTRLCDWTGNGERNLPEGGEQGLRAQKSALWYDWIYRRVADNVPYDEIVAGIVLANSREPEQSDEEYFAQMSSYFRDKDPADFAARDSMPFFWTGNRFTPPQPLRFSYAFLGIRLECAQCHKHPYDQWTKDDYDQFQLFFEGVRQGNSGAKLAKAMKEELGLTADQDSGAYKNLFARLARGGTVVPWQQVSVPDWKKARGKVRQPKNAPAGRVITPKLLGGEEVIAAEYSDPREPLLDWLTQKDNPYFARAIVNRIWSSYFGVGIIEPPDDMNLANPPSNAALLDYLSEEFVAHDFDLKWLHREIVLSATYQRSWQPNESNVLDERNFSHALVRRLPAEVAYDAIVVATANADRQQELLEDASAVRDRAIGVSSGFSKTYDGSYALKLFGKPERAISCDCERSNEPSLLQTVYLRNDGEVLSLLEHKEGWLKQVTAKGTPQILDRQDELIGEVYLRTVSRMPTADELAIGRQHLTDADDAREALKDLLWALLNTKEFLLNH